MLRTTLMRTALYLAPFVLSAQTPDPGQQVFSNICAACHGLDGQGGEHAPNIATNAEVQRMTDRELTGIVRYGIQNKGMPSFQSSLQRDQIAAVVKYLRTLGLKEASRALPGNAAEGKAVYFGPGRCAECHSLEGKGGFLGADLSGYGKNHPPDAIRAAILDPNKDARHGTVAVQTRDGKTYSGIVRNEDNFSIQLQSPDGAFHSFDKTDLLRLDRKRESLMPANYRDTLTAEQLNSLVKFLSENTGAPAKQSEDDE
jgi:cytochrome c oxidase cbb3-type subunit 3